MSANLSGGKDTDTWTVSQHNLRKKGLSEVNIRLGENLICNPRQPNKEHKNELALLPAHLDQTRMKV